MHSTKKFLSIFFNLNFTKRGETIFGECMRLKKCQILVLYWIEGQAGQITVTKVTLGS